MPIYTYRCELCGEQFERNQRFSDPPLTWCPDCGKKALRKVYSPVGIVFKGSGFYVTDNRSSSGRKCAVQNKPDEKPAVKESESKPVAAESATATTAKKEGGQGKD